MSTVALRIGGKSYTVACADGEEAHLAHLGAMVDEKLRQMEGNLALQEAQNLLFAAILLADELHEARAPAGAKPTAGPGPNAALEQELAAATKARQELVLELDALRAERDALANDLAKARHGAPPDEEGLAGRLEQLAGLIENCADTLERRRASA
ncbi:MAG: cell division protein ZapA [Erythrobacter sp.]